MIYSGVDLLRRADVNPVRAEKPTGPQSVNPAGFPQTGDQNPDPKGTLLRFARFVNQERRKKPVTKPSKHAYARAFQKLQDSDDVGRLIDIYV